MSFLRGFGATVMALAACLSGCAGEETFDEMAEPELSPLHGGSSGGTNGASDLEFSLLASEILDATTGPLVSPGTMDVHPAIVGNLLADPAGARMLDYAVQCALPASDVVNWGPKEFHGKGHLSTTDGWLSGGLNGRATNDLFACMLVHLNPYGIHVDILLTGPDVPDDGMDHSDFKVPEAVWLAEKIGPQMHYTVWPTKPFTILCAADPMDALRERVCGQNPGACSLSKGASLAQDCVRDQPSGGYYCNGKPTILTTLKEADFYDLHRLCTPPN